MRLRVPAECPTNDSRTSTPLPIHRVPAVQVPLLPRYYEGVRLPAPFPPRFVAFAWRYHPERLCSSLPLGPTPAGGLGLSGLAAPRQHFRTGGHRISQVPGEPYCAYALFSDPGRTTASGHTTSAAWPPFVATTRAPAMRHFRGSIAEPRHALSTLRRLGYPKTTQDSLLGAWPASQAGLATRRVPTKGFRGVIVTSLPPFPSLLGAMTLYATIFSQRACNEMSKWARGRS